jgi:hypothetical protein
MIIIYNDFIYNKNISTVLIYYIIMLVKDSDIIKIRLLYKFNGLILLYCLTYMSISRVSGAYDHKMHKGKVLDF